jgi:hypothetical protein
VAGRNTVAVAEALNEAVRLADPYKAALPVPLALNVELSDPVPGRNVVAVPLAENELVRVPLAGSNAVPVAELVKVAVS